MDTCHRYLLAEGDATKIQKRSVPRSATNLVKFIWLDYRETNHGNQRCPGRTLGARAPADPGARGAAMGPKAANTKIPFGTDRTNFSHPLRYLAWRSCYPNPAATKTMTVTMTIPHLQKSMCKK